MYYLRNRNSHTDVFCKTGILKNLANFIGKHLCQTLQYICFPVNFAKFLRKLYSNCLKKLLGSKFLKKGNELPFMQKRFTNNTILFSIHLIQLKYIGMNCNPIRSKCVG